VAFALVPFRNQYLFSFFSSGGRISEIQIPSIQQKSEGLSMTLKFKDYEYTNSIKEYHIHPKLAILIFDLNFK